MTKAEVVAAKIQHVAKRITEGFEISEEGDGAYIVWTHDEQPVEVVASEHGRAYAYRIPRDTDPTLPAHLMVKHATEGTYLY